MTWEEIEEEFKIAPIWLDWYCTRLLLNAQIKISNKESDANFTLLSYHKTHLDTISAFKQYSINTSKCNDDLLHEDWLRIMQATGMSIYKSN